MQSSKERLITEVVPMEGKASLVVERVIQIGEDLNVEFKRQAGLYAYVAVSHAAAKSRVRRAKNELELLTAQLSNKARKALSTNGERATREQITSWVVTQADYQEQVSKLDKAELLEDQLQVVVRALEHKRDALVGLSANYRKELPGELRSMATALTERRR